MLYNIFLLLFLLQAAIQSSHAFSSTSKSSDGGIKIVGLPGNQIESLPSMYVNTFRRWIVEDNKQLTTTDSTNNDNEDSCTLQPIKGAGISPSLSNGYVNPTTTTQLWWPSDLNTIQIRPVLNVLYRNSMISYVSAGLDVRVPYKENDVGEEEGNVISWRNYGLNSQPIARQWTTLDIAMEKMFHVEGFILQNTNSDDTDDSQQQQKPTYDTLLFPSLDNVSNVMEKVATFTAELDTLSPLADGFHIASFPLMDDWTDLPPPPPLTASTLSEEEDDVTISNQDESVYKIICLATSEPFGSKLIENGIDDDILVMSSTSILEVDVCRTAPGGESPYLTEPYKSLYLKK